MRGVGAGGPDERRVARPPIARDAPLGRDGAALGWPGELRSHWVEVGGRRMHALVTARRASRRVVVVHGLVVASRSVAPMLEAFGRRGIEAWAPDLPGFGLSDKPLRALGVEELADRLGCFIEAVGIAPVHLLGNSLGSQVAACLAERRPELVDRLVLLAPMLQPGLRRAACAALPLRGLVTTPLAERLPALARACSVLAAHGASALVRRPGPGARRAPRLATITVVEWPCAGLCRAAATVVRCLDDAIEDRLASIGAPALVLRAENDHVTRPGWVENVAKGLGDARVVTLPNLGHSAQFVGGEDVAAIVTPFLHGEPGRGARA